jgi:hypothetical protein
MFRNPQPHIANVNLVGLSTTSKQAKLR